MKKICESCGGKIESLRGPSYLEGKALCQYCFIRAKFKKIHPLKLERLLEKVSERIAEQQRLKK